MRKPTVAVLVHAADARACVTAGVGAGLAVRHHDGVHDLLHTLDTEDVVLAVIDAVDPSGHSMASVVTAIRRGFPAIPVLAYCALSSAASSAVLDVARAGATGLVFRGVDDAGYAMRAAIQSARQGSVSQRIHDEVTRLVPSVAHPLLRYALSRASDDPSVDDAAKSLGVDRKTLFNWLRQCGPVRPREFINWIRLAIAVGMLADPHRTAEQVALDLGFPSGASLRNMLHRYTNASCSEIRGADGLPRVLALFRARLEAAPDVDERLSIAPAERKAFTPVVPLRA